ncbi:MAG: glutamyl-tRNA reductase [Haloferacaceae archaeon]
MTREGILTGVVVAHDRATVDEIAAAGAPDDATRVESLLAREGVSEALSLRTCNRAEAYVVADSPDAGRAALSDFAPEVRDGAVRTLRHEECLRHLMRVAAGLESQVLGEDEIIGQVRDAVETARAVGGVGPVLDRATTKALHVGERARSETAINEGTTSLARAGVDLAAESTPLDGADALVVGAGEMAAAAADALADAGVAHLTVANRTVANAERVAARVDVPAVAAGLDVLAERAAEADVIATATASPDPLLGPQAFADAEETTVVDLALPRDVAPSVDDVDGVEVRDIDALETVTERTHERRRAAADRVEEIVEEELDRLLSSFKRERADEAIAGMYEGAERVKARQLAAARDRMEANGGLTPEQEEALEDFADALVGQLLAAPTRSLRAAAEEDDWTTIRTAMELFDPSFDGAPDPATPDGPREGRPDGRPDPTGATADERPDSDD